MFILVTWLECGEKFHNVSETDSKKIYDSQKLYDSQNIDKANVILADEKSTSFHQYL